MFLPQQLPSSLGVHIPNPPILFIPCIMCISYIPSIQFIVSNTSIPSIPCIPSMPSIPPISPIPGADAAAWLLTPTPTPRDAGAANVVWLPGLTREPATGEDCDVACVLCEKEPWLPALDLCFWNHHWALGYHCHHRHRRHNHHSPRKQSIVNIIVKIIKVFFIPIIAIVFVASAAWLAWAVSSFSA